MDELAKDFPDGPDLRDPATTRRPSPASRSARCSRRCATPIILVALVVLLFLQNWRSALIPLIAVPVAIIGTFAAMAGDGLQPEQPDAVRPGAGHRHRRRRRDRGGRGRRAPHRAGAVAARGDHQGDGRGLRPGDRRRAGALRGVRALRVHQRHHRPVLPPVRPDDRRLDDHLGVQLADAQPGPGGPAAAAARARSGATPLPRLAFALAGGWLGWRIAPGWPMQLGRGRLRPGTVPWLAAAGARWRRLLVSWPINAMLALVFPAVQRGLRRGRPASTRWASAGCCASACWCWSSTAACWS